MPPFAHPFRRSALSLALASLLTPALAMAAAASGFRQ